MPGTLCLVSDVMTRSAAALRAGTAFQDIAKTMRRWKVSALPVPDGGLRVTGAASEADLLPKRCSGSSGSSGSAGHRPGVRGRPAAQGVFRVFRVFRDFRDGERTRTRGRVTATASPGRCGGLPRPWACPGHAAGDRTGRRCARRRRRGAGRAHQGATQPWSLGPRDTTAPGGGLRRSPGEDRGCRGRRAAWRGRGPSAHGACRRRAGSGISTAGRCASRRRLWRLRAGPSRSSRRVCGQPSDPPPSGDDRSFAKSRFLSHPPFPSLPLFHWVSARAVEQGGVPAVRDHRGAGSPGSAHRPRPTGQPCTTLCDDPEGTVRRAAVEVMAISSQRCSCGGAGMVRCRSRRAVRRSPGSRRPDDRRGHEAAHHPAPHGLVG